MSQSNISIAQTPEGKRLQELWQPVTESLVPQTAAKAAFMGVNLRVNLLEALNATWKTAEVAIKSAVAMHTPFDLAEWLGIGVEAISAVRSIYSSLVQYMPPINYVAYVILSKTPQGLPENTLKLEIEKFLNDPSSANFEWYLGMRKGLLDQARKATELKTWFETVMQKLKNDEMIGRDGGVVKFKPRNFIFDMKSESE
jgi:hypothetical protein